MQIFKNYKKSYILGLHGSRDTHRPITQITFQPELKMRKKKNKENTK